MAEGTGKRRNLVLILGDQLDHQSSALDGFDRSADLLWMAEVAEESTHVWTSRPRIVVFLSAMRHFADWLRGQDYPLDYHALPEQGGYESFSQALAAALKAHKPERIVLCRPGEWRVLEAIKATSEEAGVELELREDRHFYSTPEEFNDWAEGRSELRLEYFYRELRKRHGVLMDGSGPVGGVWNFDKENRGNFGKKGPGELPAPPVFKPDALTREVIALVDSRFGRHPGSLENFCWPVDRQQALEALNAFIAERLPRFGQYQDAMWVAEPFLYHSLLSAALNLKLLHPREVVEVAEAAYGAGKVPLAAAEGFIRQILGWREYVRGVYWRFMPGYLERNTLQAGEPLPDFYWSGETEFTCLREVIGQTLDYGYAHHIQRLMVTGLYALLLGVDPKAVHAWYLAVYVDAVEWVELPNTLGMSQYGDGGVMASKPYVATGKYIQRMSNYCMQCPRKPADATGPKACPFTTLYWDFLQRHAEQLRDNRRMGLQLKNLQRKSQAELDEIRQLAVKLRENPAGELRHNR